MSKVKLTREQAEALEEVMKDRTKTSLIRESANPFMSAGGYMCEKNHIVFNEIDLETLIKALYIGYEVEETFKVGDWIVTKDGMVAEIIDVCMFHKDSVALYEVDGRHSFATLRHATPEEIAKEKQRRWWAKHGREVWELRKGDVIEKLCSPYDFEAWEITGTDEQYIYAKDNHMINPKTTQMDANYRVICFAEDRKDVQV